MKPSIALALLFMALVVIALPFCLIAGIWVDLRWFPTGILVIIFALVIAYLADSFHKKGR